MEFIRNDDWIRRVAASEAELECDISAGLNIGSHFSEYTSLMQNSKNYISGEKLMAVLQEELGNLLPNEDLEAIACATQSFARNRLVERTRLTKNAS
jgi:hypothetical protein